ncbi:MAG: GNAT family N-acetyltransferase [Enterococcus lacertideformus]|uniref:GNAT family N-acetyltransferase n=1 Tax=Enterococcus lacertideformus TaxID=2771493 RepID=A0A931AWK8_9ENTE|nr:GNAT family N-acetyltransferase [Enterococcus lacertideformus]
MTVAAAEKLQAISIETYQDTFGEYNSEELMTVYLNKDYEINKLVQELQDENTEFYWALLDGEIAGYMKLNVDQAQTEKMGDHYLEIERIYVRPPFKSKGIGSKLISLAIEKAQEKQKEAIWLGVWEHNYSALNFYKKHGFSHYSQHIFYMGDDAQTDYLFVKNLNK